MTSISRRYNPGERGVAERDPQPEVGLGFVVADESPAAAGGVVEFGCPSEDVVASAENLDIEPR